MVPGLQESLDQLEEVGNPDRLMFGLCSRIMLKCQYRQTLEILRILFQDNAIK